jgi:hypothetical protein
MGPHRKLGIYIGYSSLSIIKYLEPLTGDLFTARFANCIFNEDHFPALGGESYQNKCPKIEWNAKGISFQDPHTIETEQQVQRIIDLQNIANNLLDAFTDYKGVTKSYHPARNVPERVEVPNKTTQPPINNKRGRNTSKKQDESAKKQKKIVKSNTNLVTRHLEDIVCPMDNNNPQAISVMRINTGASSLELLGSTIEGNNDGSLRVEETVINFVETGESYDRKSIIVDCYFSKEIANVFHTDLDPKSMAECKKRSDWDKWKEAIEAEITSLNKRKVFSAVRPTPPGILPVGHKWVFVRKRNENNEVVRYKARLVAQGFTQRPDVDFNETYSPVTSGITFRYLISLAVQNRLSMQLMDVVTTYLYGSLDSDIYMNVPDGIHVPDNKANRNMYCIKLQK